VKDVFSLFTAGSFILDQKKPLARDINSITENTILKPPYSLSSALKSSKTLPSTRVNTVPTAKRMESLLPKYLPLMFTGVRLMYRALAAGLEKETAKYASR
jgi:hypothetical protein